MKDNHSHISPELYEKYLKGELSAKESYEVEKILQSSLLHQEAMDGFESIAPQDLQKDLANLRKKINLNQNKPERKSLWMKIAAAITLLIMSGTILWLLTENQPTSQNQLSDIVQPTEERKDSSANKESITANDNDSFSNDVLANSLERELKESVSTAAPALERANKPPKKILEKAPVIKDEEIQEDLDINLDVEVAESFDELTLEDDLMEEEEITEESVAMNESKKADRFIQLERSKKEKDLSKNISSAPAYKLDSNFNRDISFSKTYSVSEDSLFVESNYSFYMSPKPVGGFKILEKYLIKNKAYLEPKKKSDQIQIMIHIKMDSTISKVQFSEGNKVIFPEIRNIILSGPKWVPLKDSTKNQLTLTIWKKR